MGRRIAIGVVLLGLLAAAFFLIRDRRGESKESSQVVDAGVNALSATVRERWQLRSAETSIESEQLVEADRTLDPQKPALLLEVRDFLGGPVAGAVIQGNNDEILARSDGAGFARIERAPLHVRTLTVLAAGYAPRKVATRRFGHVVVELIPESEIFGVVLFRSDETPVSRRLSASKTKK